MQIPSPRKYTGVAISLHWAIAVLIIGGFALGWVMTDIPGFTPTKLRYYSWHKWIGVTVLLLAVLRLLWRVTHRPPDFLGTHRLENAVAHVVHFLLYLLIFAVPISGYLYSSVTGIQVVYLGLIPLPTLLAPDMALRAPLREVHVVLDYTLAAVVALHLLGVIKHMVIDRHRILSRMLPFGD